MLVLAIGQFEPQHLALSVVVFGTGWNRSLSFWQSHLAEPIMLTASEMHNLLFSFCCILSTLMHRLIL